MNARLLEVRSSAGGSPALASAVLAKTSAPRIQARLARRSAPASSAAAGARTGPVMMARGSSAAAIIPHANDAYDANADVPRRLPLGSLEIWITSLASSGTSAER